MHELFSRNSPTDIQIPINPRQQKNKHIHKPVFLSVAEKYAAAPDPSATARPSALLDQETGKIRTSPLTRGFCSFESAKSSVMAAGVTMAAATTGNSSRSVLR